MTILEQRRLFLYWAWKEGSTGRLEVMREADLQIAMVNAKDLGERISRMFNFMYEVKGDYYVLGSDYFRPCTDMEMEVYKGFSEALKGGSEDWIIDQYKRVRKYVSDCQACSRAREQEIVEFVQRLGVGELESLGTQVDRAMGYAQSAYK